MTNYFKGCGRRKREGIFRVLAWMIFVQLTLITWISGLRKDVWIEGSMRYPSGDVE